MNITELQEPESETTSPSELAGNLNDKEINDPSIRPGEKRCPPALDVVNEPEIHIVDVKPVRKKRDGDRVFLGFEIKQG